MEIGMQRFKKERHEQSFETYGTENDFEGFK